MTETINMSYKGMVFSANPSSIKTDFRRKTETKHIPFGFGKTTEICRLPAKITGSGKFVGAGAGEKAYNLMRVFEKEGSSYLFLPEFPPVKVYFTDLSVNLNAKDYGVEYTFEFTEDCVGKKSRFAFGYTYAKRGENLFDISNRCDVSFDKLFEINDFPDMFSVSEGDKVWLK